MEPKDAWTLFKLMDVHGQGTVDASEFVEGCVSASKTQGFGAGR